jgi:hypothetical protein
MSPRRALLIGPAFAFALAAAAGAQADSLVSLPDPAYADPASNVQVNPNLDRVRSLIYPTIGCPAYLPPGGTVEPVLRLPASADLGDLSAEIRTSRDIFTQTYRLRLVSNRRDAPTATFRPVFEVPGGIPEDTYDLTIRSMAIAGGVETQPNAVRLTRATTDIDVVQISDTQIRDPQSSFPQKFEEVLDELRLRDPDVVLFSGDVNFGMDYEPEYAENWEIMRRHEVALSCAPGNHDGYGWVDPKDATRIIYDGLFYWRRTFGPLYYSFRLGETRFVAVNSYDGSTARRNSFTFLNVNDGGQIEAPQLAWLEAEARAATAAGEEAVLFLHHNPSKAVRPNAVSYPWDITHVADGEGVWNDQRSKDEVFRIAAENAAVGWFFVGHTNYDEDVVQPLGPPGGPTHPVHFVNTTTVCNRGRPTEGYRWITVRGGRVRSIDFDPPAAPSVPFPLGGNLAARFLDPNDGAHESVRAEVENVLPKPVDVTLRFYMPPDRRGYRASGGRVRAVGVADVGAYVVYVRATAPAQGKVTVALGPDPQGQGAQPGYVAPAVGASGSGGGGGGGCAADPEHGSALRMVFPALFAGAIIALRRRARRA